MNLRLMCLPNSKSANALILFAVLLAVSMLYAQTPAPPPPAGQSADTDDRLRSV